ncbi:hypothetical protein EVAR_59572_1 [Eumeta japonica]|uniref:Uncharacterized protein n=1 Tax=Eumeta variegata TaxID=151549 RepID=A0A4C1Z8C2_EUMVA|nr:hypothetical protein EVAR_59572_1 [Eumeta japonica]
MSICHRKGPIVTLDGYDRNKLSITTTSNATWPTQKLAKQAKAMGCGQETKRTKMAFHTMTSQCGCQSGRCPLPLKWLSWTMADRPVVLVNECRATGPGPPSRKETVLER